MEGTSNRNWRWLYWMVMLVFGGIVIYQCNHKEANQDTQAQEKLIGDFVYVDLARVLHTKNGCTAVLKERNTQPVTPKKTEEVNIGDIEKVCSQCVTGEQYAMLKALAESNQLDADTVEVGFNEY